MASDQDLQEASANFGLVPLFPLPSLTQARHGNDVHSTVSIPSNPMRSLAHFLPPIFSRRYDAYAVDELAPIEVDRILAEVVAEELLDILEKLFEDGGSFLDVAISGDLERRSALEDWISKSLASSLLEEVVDGLARDVVLDCLDDMIHGHSAEIESRLFFECFLTELTASFVEEIAGEEIALRSQEEASAHILEDVLKSEVSHLVEDTLTNYGAQFAFGQYKRISQFAADSVLDAMCLQALLPKPQTASFNVSYLLDHVTMGILLEKASQVNEARLEETCVPLQWYRKKVLQSVALDAALDGLCEDE